jgi:glycosyltransferase involved in cell wall biosynthesis
MSNITYSIIIPHKDRINLLKVLLDSIPSRQDIEVIIVDDASIMADKSSLIQSDGKHPTTTVSTQHTDRSKSCHFKDIISRNKSRFNALHIIYNQTSSSLGAGWARNQGLDIAQGEYLIFADSDDYFTKNAFDTFDKSRTSYPLSDFIVHKALSIKMDGTKGTRTDFTNHLIDFGIEKKDPTLTKQIGCKIDPPWAKLIKKQLIKEHHIRFDEIPIANDVMFNFNVIKYTSSITFSNSLVYCVLEHSNTLGNMHNKKTHYTRLITLNRFISRLSQTSFKPKKPISVCGGYIWGARKYGWTYMLICLKKVIQNNDPLIYPVGRYLFALYYKLIGISSLDIRLYLIFGNYSRPK